MKTECTFTPNTKKPFIKNVVQQTFRQIDDRTSIGSINLDGIARKRDTDDVFEQASSLKKSMQTTDTSRGKHDQLYSMRKRQLDKTDKTKEDYEFERQGQECTFAPKTTKNPKYIRDRV